MANTSVSLVDLDFETIKSNLKAYLKSSDSPFKDVDFEGSNISHLLDVLSYNTFLNAYYLNMVASEMFLDTAQLKDSVVSHAKELNYIPRSYRSAEANISFNVTPSTPGMSVLVIPKGTTFTSKVGSNNYSFTTNESQTSSLNSNGQFVISTAVYEGSYVTDSFTFAASNTSQRFVLSNPTVDTRSIVVTVVEDNGATTAVFNRATSFLGYTNTSKIYFLQAAENSQYEIVFGDGVIGQLPKNGATVLVEYRVCSGELPNGARTFDIDGPISGQSNISSVVVTSVATGGAVGETVESIKLNAPRHFQNQERAITSSDFETLLISNFPEIQAVSAFGGEDAIPPQYGKVFIAVDNKNMDGASESQKQKYYEFIKPRAPLSIDPVFIDPEFLYVEVWGQINYNTNITTLQASDIMTLVKSAISKYANDNLNGFNKTLRGSRLSEVINAAHPSIVSNSIREAPYKKLLIVPGVPYSEIIDFGFPLTTQFVVSQDDSVIADIKAVYSMNFTYNGRLCNIQDDRNGKLGIYTAEGSDRNTFLLNVGTVDYSTGEVIISNLIADSVSGPHVHLYVTALQRDITSSKNYILTIEDEDIEITINPIKQ